MIEEVKCPIRIDSRCTGIEGCLYGQGGVCHHPVNPHEPKPDVCPECGGDKNYKVMPSEQDPHRLTSPTYCPTCKGTGLKPDVEILTGDDKQAYDDGKPDHIITNVIGEPKPDEGRLLTDVERNQAYKDYLGMPEEHGLCFCIAQDAKTTGILLGKPDEGLRDSLAIIAKCENSRNCIDDTACAVCPSAVKKTDQILSQVKAKIEELKIQYEGATLEEVSNAAKIARERAISECGDRIEEAVTKERERIIETLEWIPPMMDFQVGGKLYKEWQFAKKFITERGQALKKGEAEQSSKGVADAPTDT